MKALFFMWFSCVALFVVLLYEESSGEVHKSSRSNEKIGFWGHVTANIDWCESNYSLTPYVAEFWNALSSFSFVLSSLVGVYLTLKYRMEKRFLFCFLSICLVGLGSILFHSTLLRFTQSLDELPMILSALIFVYIIQTMDDSVDSKDLAKKKLALVLGSVGGSILFIYALFPDNPIVFQGAYVILVCYVVWESVQMYRRCHSAEAKQLLEVAMVFYITGCFLWMIEPRVCSSVGWLNLHAWWHVLVCCGIYLEVLFFKYIRLISLGHRPSIVTMSTPTLLPSIHYHLVKLA